MNVWQLIQVGGATVYLLIMLSVLSISIIVERIVYYQRRSKIRREEFMEFLGNELKKGNLGKAKNLCKNWDTPFASVVLVGLHAHGQASVLISNAMERQVTIEATKLEKRISVLGTIGSTAVYIGLFGTVLGIIRAFQDIASSFGGGGAGMSVVVNGIAEALVCTAVGLCVAVPAVIAYNFFVKKVDNFVTDMELSVSQTLDLLTVTDNG